MPYDGNTDYMAPSDVWKALVALQTAYSGDCKVFDMSTIPVGDNVKPKYVEITKGLAPKDLRVLITGGIHAREMSPPDILVSLAEVLLKNNQGATAIKIGGNPGYPLAAANVQQIIAKLDVFIAPLVNPVGRSYAMNFDSEWRKNRRPLGPRAPRAVGVDINRNFDILWDFPHKYDRDKQVQNSLKAHTSTHPPDDTFKGFDSLSEIETLNLKNVFDLHQPAFVFDIHSFGPTILFPWGVGLDQTTKPNMNFENRQFDGKRDGQFAKKYKEWIPLLIRDRHVALANTMHDAIQQISPRKRGVDDYPVSEANVINAKPYVRVGAFDDYSFRRSGPQRDQVKAFTIECGDVTRGKFKPNFRTEYPGIENEVHAALLSALDMIAQKGPDLGLANPVGQPIPAP